jgi:DUF4097 and DUF4098 domain-containing protein YvlB
MPDAITHRRSLSGPIVLIILGVVFLLGNLGYLTWPSIGRLFAHYWPLLLIVWGVIKLVEHYNARRGGYAAAGIGAGGVLLILLVVIAGIAATTAERVNWSAVHSEIGVEDDFFGVFGNSYTFSDELQQAFPAGGTLRVASDRGNVIITPWDQPQLKLVVHKKVYAKDENESKKVNESTRPVITAADKLVTVNANTTGGGGRGVTSDMELFIPKKAAVDISTRHGDIVVRSREGDVKGITSHGDMTLEDIAGNAQLTLRRGSLHASRIAGDLALDGRVDDTTIADVSGAVHLTGDFFGDMNVSKVAKGVTFKSSRTDLEMARLDGTMNMQSGDFTAKSVAGPFRLLTRSKDIHLEDISGDIRLENANGAVEVHAGKLPLGQMTIENRKGDIKLVLPAQAAFQLNASTRRGEIESDFSELKVDSTHGDTKANGSVGGGGPRVQINNEYGGIEIRKS